MWVRNKKSGRVRLYDDAFARRLQKSKHAGKYEFSEKNPLVELPAQTEPYELESEPGWRADEAREEEVSPEPKKRRRRKENESE